MNTFYDIEFHMYLAFVKIFQFQFIIKVQYHFFIKLIIVTMQSDKQKRKIRVKQLEGTQYLISEDQFLGKGCFGQVYKAYNKQKPQQQLVAKIIPLDQQYVVQSIQGQVQILRSLPTHVNLVNCKKTQISSSKNFYLIMQYCNGGSLEDFLNKTKNISQPQIWHFISQFCRGYQVLYDNNLIHRDIKPDNILIHNGIYKIADFGLAKKLQKNIISQRLSIKGTPLYMAPQLKQKQFGSSKVDVFSLGIVIFRMAYRNKYPFGSDYKSSFEYFQALEYKQLKIPQFPQRSPQLQKLILMMLEKESQNRISWEQIFKHPKINMKCQQDEQQFDNELEDLSHSMDVIKKSVANVTFHPSKTYFRDQIQKQQQQFIEFEQVIPLTEFKLFEEKLFKSKVIVTIIRHTNHKIQELLQTKIHQHIAVKLQTVLKLGYRFSLEIIQFMTEQLQKPQYKEVTVSNPEKINRIKKAIEQQKQIFLKSLQNLKEQFDPLLSMMVRQQYPTYLQQFLRQFSDYPSSIKQFLRTIISLLIDIYDAGIKYMSGQVAEEGTKFDQIKPKTNNLKQYLLLKESISQKQILEDLQQIGLLLM